MRGSKVVASLISITLPGVAMLFAATPARAEPSVPQSVSPPADFSLTLDGSLQLGGFVFKDESAFLHNDGGTGNGNTALGVDALISLEADEFAQEEGRNNTAVGEHALRATTTGYENTAVGSSSLPVNTIGLYNTAVGAHTLYSNVQGSSNTALGVFGLYSNTIGSGNTAVGAFALASNSGVEAAANTAVGYGSLWLNTEGEANTALGARALYGNSTGEDNTSLGAAALFENQGGSRNVAIGHAAGRDATGDDNIYVSHQGVAEESGVIRIGTEGVQTATHIAGIFSQEVDPGSAMPVRVDSSGKLGTTRSSRRFKRDIHALGGASDRIHSLRPVSFRYRSLGAADQGPVQFGLLAEEVAQVFPELVIYDAGGDPLGVRYDQLSSLLLQEVQDLDRRSRFQGWMMALMLALTWWRRQAGPGAPES